MSATTQLTTGKVRFSYVNIWERDKNGKFTLALLIPKTDIATIKKIKDAVQLAYENGAAKFGKASLKTLKTPLRDGDEEKDGAEYAGHLFMNCSTKRRPGIVDADLEEIIDPEELYSGCYGQAQVNMYPFAVDGNKGIACGLNFVRKLEDGEPLAGPSMTAAEAFGDDDDLMG